MERLMKLPAKNESAASHYTHILAEMPLRSKRSGKLRAYDRLALLG
jgi:hypothetical protein